MARPSVIADEWVVATLAETIALHERVKQGDLSPLTDAAAALVSSIRSGGTLLIFGNGGSASDAQHVAAEPGRPLSARAGADGRHRTDDRHQCADEHRKRPFRTLLHVICDLLERALAE